MGDQRVVAIIPVRGGSRGIPRKNARLLAGRPLLVYGIEAAQKSLLIDEVYVSTDDPELAELARRSNARVLDRPWQLAEANVGLDEVIHDAVRTLEAQGERCDYVVTLQATSPLIRPQTLDAAVSKCMRDGYETVLTVYNDPHLTWGSNGNGHVVPLYEQRVNRQLLPACYRESGSCVVARREILETGTRFGKNVGVIELDKAEALDIDDYFDWWLAEKSLMRKKICFHVLGNRSTGLGHVYRALTLADRLIDHDLTFLVNGDSGLAADIIRKRFYPVQTVEPGMETRTILQNPPDLVINDVLDTDESFIHALKGAGIATINFEDMGTGSRVADYVINAMYNNHPYRKDANILSGPSCCCLRDEFYSILPREPRPKVENVLLLFGGTDPSGMTLRAAEWVDALEEEFSVTVIIGGGYPHQDRIEALAETAKHPMTVVTNSPIISRYMSEADVAVTSAGRTVFELGSLGVPMMVVAQNEREMTHTFAKTSPGAIFLGRAQDIDQATFTSTFQQLVASELLRQKMHQALLDSGLREGIDKVTGVIESALKSRNGVLA